MLIPNYIKNYQVIFNISYSSSLELLRRIISLAKNNPGILKPSYSFSFWNLTPRFLDFSFFSSYSNTIENNSGDRMHPCFIPIFRSMSLDKLLSLMICILVLLQILYTLSKSSLQIPSYLSLVRISDRYTVSKAFLISKAAQQTVLFL